MKPESSEYRKKLAGEITQAPKEERAGILDQAKASSEYWQARKEKIDEVQEEESIDEGLGVFLKKKTLYHGSSVHGIEAMNLAEEDTVGNGIYFTSEPKDAIGYARVRAKSPRSKREGEPPVPVIYEASVENARLIDLRKDENVKIVLQGFGKVLLEKIKDPDIAWNVQAAFIAALEEMSGGQIKAGNLRLITANAGPAFTAYVKSLGYDGLITIEGGEGMDKEDPAYVGNHDSYVIFDPEKAKIDQEHEIL